MTNEKTLNLIAEKLQKSYVDMIPDALVSFALITELNRRWLFTITNNAWHDGKTSDDYEVLIEITQDRYKAFYNKSLKYALIDAYYVPIKVY